MHSGTIDWIYFLIASDNEMARKAEGSKFIVMYQHVIFIY